MKALEVICSNLEHTAEDLEYLRHGCEVVGLQAMADHLASLAKDVRQNIATLQAQTKPRRIRAPKLIVNNAKH
jgi:hypothetical protein